MIMKACKIQKAELFLVHCLSNDSMYAIVITPYNRVKEAVFFVILRQR